MSYSDKFRKYCDYLISQNIEIDDYTEFKFESIMNCSDEESIDQIINWYQYKKENSKMKTKVIPLSECRNWKFSENNSDLFHVSEQFYKIMGYRVEGTGNREVPDGWDQPLITQVGFDGGILGLIRKRFTGFPFYLVEAKEEPGNYNKVQISTTIQATFSNLMRAHKGSQTPYSNIFLDYKNYPVKLILEQWMSEDGGRLFNKRNKIMIIEYDENEELKLISDNYKWLTLNQIKNLIINNNSIIAPHLRSAISGI